MFELKLSVTQTLFLIALGNVVIEKEETTKTRSRKNHQTRFRNPSLRLSYVLFKRTTFHSEISDF